jgi:hypothetical protein
MTIMKRAYRIFLRFYPRDYRAMFGPAMRTTFAASLEELSGGAYARFCLAEVYGLLAGALVEWAVKLTTDPSTRGRTLPDRLLMRPPGVSWTAFYGGTFLDEL